VEISTNSFQFLRPSLQLTRRRRMRPRPSSRPPPRAQRTTRRRVVSAGLSLVAFSGPRRTLQARQQKRQRVRSLQWFRPKTTKWHLCRRLLPRLMSQYRPSQSIPQQSLRQSTQPLQLMTFLQLVCMPRRRLTHLLPRALLHHLIKVVSWDSSRDKTPSLRYVVGYYEDMRKLTT
jgi:hypothetical protein